VVVSTAERPEVNLTVDPASLVPPGAFGTFDLFVTDGTDMDHPIGFVAHAAESLDAARAENERRLNCISTPEVGDCVRICRARNALLTDLPGSENSAQFMLDLVVLAREVSREIDLLERGENPYRRRPGDHWRIITVGDGEVPARLYAPARACTDEPAPLIIALHGAGADENVFPDAYGMGVIKRLADEHGFLLVSPRVGYFSAAPLVLDSIIEAASRDYAVDAQRIYLLGHSMGGGIVTAWCRMRPNRIAAACTIAGIGGFPPGASIPPVLVIAAELDELVPAERVQRSAERAIDAGLPLAFRLIKGYGHTLVVGAVQPEVVPWLLEHRLAVPAPPESDAVPQP
jgi:predicted esterase